jgi:hypothetical protein
MLDVAPHLNTHTHTATDLSPLSTSRFYAVASTALRTLAKA